MLYRAILFTEDLSQQDITMLTSYYVVQDLDYTVGHYRNEKGTPYDLTQPVLLNFTLRQTEGSFTREFYERLQSTNSNIVSIVYDAETDGMTSRVKTFGSSVIFRGYVTDVQECFDSSKSAETGMEEQMLVRVQMLLDHITYQGEDMDTTLTIFDN